MMALFVSSTDKCIHDLGDNPNLLSKALKALSDIDCEVIMAKVRMSLGMLVMSQQQTDKN